MIEKPSTANIGGSKQHFQVLDGLRGVAAFAIVIFHLMEWIYADFTKNFIAHGFLAVDFFFCLSGFVIAYSYDDRIQKIGAMQFFKLRLVRLHPLVLLGSVFGLIGYLADPFVSPVTLSAGRLLFLFLASALLIPAPIMEERVFNLFGLNAPAWSLFWEYVANLFYALVLYKVGRKSLLTLTVIAAIGISFVSYRSGNLLGGWSKDNIPDGGARVAYSFLAGMLIYRSNWIIKNKLGFAGMALLLSLAFVMPWTSWNALTESLVVLLYFPLMVALGAGSTTFGTWKSVCNFAGKLSYPLYMTHYAGIWLFANYYTTRKPPTSELSILVPVITVFMILFAWLVMVLYDGPVRRYLTQHLIPGKSQRN
jgi:peptidoglycan/LPS O-acetylase OafA/YrhL